MKVLYVTGACLRKNTSANMSHNAFLKGLLDNKCDVDVIMADDSWGENDSQLPVFDGVNYFEFNATSFADRIRLKSRNIISTSSSNGSSDEIKTDTTVVKIDVKSRVRKTIKKAFYLLFKRDPVYPLDKKWLKTAGKFKNDTKYDLVVSNSSPAASHKLVEILTCKNRIHYKRWVQIWEDPWFFDLYGGHSDIIREEEQHLLRCASEVYYVSPLTLMYQKSYFPDCASKMKCIPLPFLDFSGADDTAEIEPCSFGYFGDYYSVTRNLNPFYEALVQSGYNGYIYGDNDLSLSGTEKIQVSGRVTLDVLSEIQKKTDVLVHLSNLKGGQIPGKIYHYSATTKPILFILDGTKEEKEILLDFFGRFNRYYFCDNKKESIILVMQDIIKKGIDYRPVEEFRPVNVVKKILQYSKCDRREKDDT